MFNTVETSFTRVERKFRNFKILTIWIFIQNFLFSRKIFKSMLISSSNTLFDMLEICKEKNYYPFSGNFNIKVSFARNTTVDRDFSKEVWIIIFLRFPLVLRETKWSETNFRSVEGNGRLYLVKRYPRAYLEQGINNAKRGKRHRTFTRLLA